LLEGILKFKPYSNNVSAADSLFCDTPCKARTLRETQVVTFIELAREVRSVDAVTIEDRDSAHTTACEAHQHPAIEAASANAKNSCVTKDILVMGRDPIVSGKYGHLAVNGRRYSTDSDEFDQISRLWEDRKILGIVDRCRLHANVCRRFMFHRSNLQVINMVLARTS